MSSEKITWIFYEFKKVDKEDYFLDRFDKINVKDKTLYFRLKNVEELVPQGCAIFLEKNERLYKMTDKGINKFVLNYINAKESLLAKMEGRIN